MARPIDPKKPGIASQTQTDATKPETPISSSESNCNSELESCYQEASVSIPQTEPQTQTLFRPDAQNSAKLYRGLEFADDPYAVLSMVGFSGNEKGFEAAFTFWVKSALNHNAESRSALLHFRDRLKQLSQSDPSLVYYSELLQKVSSALLEDNEFLLRHHQDRWFSDGAYQRDLGEQSKTLLKLAEQKSRGEAFGEKYNFIVQTIERFAEASFRNTHPVPDQGEDIRYVINLQKFVTRKLEEAKEKSILPADTQIQIDANITAKARMLAEAEYREKNLQGLASRLNTQPQQVYQEILQALHQNNDELRDLISWKATLLLNLKGLEGKSSWENLANLGWPADEQTRELFSDTQGNTPNFDQLLVTTAKARLHEKLRTVDRQLKAAYQKNFSKSPATLLLALFEDPANVGAMYRLNYANGKDELLAFAAPKLDACLQAAKQLSTYIASHDAETLANSGLSLGTALSGAFAQVAQSNNTTAVFKGTLGSMILYALAGAVGGATFGATGAFAADTLLASRDLINVRQQVSDLEKLLPSLGGLQQQVVDAGQLNKIWDQTLIMTVVGIAISAASAKVMAKAHTRPQAVDQPFARLLPYNTGDGVLVQLAGGNDVHVTTAQIRELFPDAPMPKTSAPAQKLPVTVVQVFEDGSFELSDGRFLRDGKEIAAHEIASSTRRTQVAALEPTLPGADEAAEQSARMAVGMQDSPQLNLRGVAPEDAEVSIDPNTPSMMSSGNGNKTELGYPKPASDFDGTRTVRDQPLDEGPTVAIHSEPSLPPKRAAILATAYGRWMQSTIDLLHSFESGFDHHPITTLSNIGKLEQELVFGGAHVAHLSPLERIDVLSEIYLNKKALKEFSDDTIQIHSIGDTDPVKIAALENIEALTLLRFQKVIQDLSPEWQHLPNDLLELEGWVPERLFNDNQINVVAWRQHIDNIARQLGEQDGISNENPAFARLYVLREQVAGSGIPPAVSPAPQLLTAQQRVETILSGNFGEYVRSHLTGPLNRTNVHTALYDFISGDVYLLHPAAMDFIDQLYQAAKQLPNQANVVGNWKTTKLEIFMEYLAGPLNSIPREVRGKIPPTFAGLDVSVTSHRQYSTGEYPTSLLQKARQLITEAAYSTRYRSGEERTRVLGEIERITADLDRKIAFFQAFVPAPAKIPAPVRTPPAPRSPAEDMSLTRAIALGDPEQIRSAVKRRSRKHTAIATTAATGVIGVGTAVYVATRPDKQEAPDLTQASTALGAAQDALTFISSQPASSAAPTNSNVQRLFPLFSAGEDYIHFLNDLTSQKSDAVLNGHLQKLMQRTDLSREYKIKYFESAQNLLLRRNEVNTFKEKYSNDPESVRAYLSETYHITPKGKVEVRYGVSSIGFTLFDKEDYTRMRGHGKEYQDSAWAGYNDEQKQEKLKKVEPTGGFAFGNSFYFAHSAHEGTELHERGHDLDGAGTWFGRERKNVDTSNVSRYLDSYFEVGKAVLRAEYMQYFTEGVTAAGGAAPDEQHPALSRFDFEIMTIEQGKRLYNPYYTYKLPDLMNTQYTGDQLTTALAQLETKRQGFEEYSAQIFHELQAAQHLITHYETCCAPEKKEAIRDKVLGFMRVSPSVEDWRMIVDLIVFEMTSDERKKYETDMKDTVEHIRKNGTPPAPEQGPPAPAAPTEAPKPKAKKIRAKKNYNPFEE